MHGYYEYQNVKTNEEYYEMLREQVYNEENRGKAIEIPVFRNCQFDLDRLCLRFNKFIECIFKKENELEEYSEFLKCPLYYYLQVSHTSFIAPAYNYNCYLDLLINTNLKHMNHESNEHSNYINYLYTIHIQNVFVSIKSLLDRIVTILSFFYPGVSIETTFGHITGNKSKGFMSVVSKGVEKGDLFMKFIYDEYENWIKDVVQPRNTIMHYNDFDTSYHWTNDGREFPVFKEVKLFSDNADDRFCSPDEGHSYKTILHNVQDLYYFFDVICACLEKSDIVYRKYHFKDKGEYEKYRKSIEQL